MKYLILIFVCFNVFAQNNPDSLVYQVQIEKLKADLYKSKYEKQRAMADIQKLSMENIQSSTISLVGIEVFGTNTKALIKLNGYVNKYSVGEFVGDYKIININKNNILVRDSDNKAVTLNFAK